MITFILGLVILFVGAALYGKFCEKVFGPDDRKTPAYTKEDGVDYVPMRGWKNSLINLLNIAGTGPILGPIQGILFGPIAFITIPIGNIIGGAMHDYFSGMICLRDGGTQMPDMIRKYSNKGVYTFYQIFCSLLLLLVGAVFIYTPGDIAATQVFGFDGAVDSVSTWVIYGVIFVYYLIATVFPIDKIIGRIYPIFGAILLFSAVGVFIGIFALGFPLNEIWEDWNAGGILYGDYFRANHFIPIFFITVACGILSGFHSTQTAIISRTMKSEKQGRMTFYNMMVVEGFIAMVWQQALWAFTTLDFRRQTLPWRQLRLAWYVSTSSDRLEESLHFSGLSFCRLHQEIQRCARFVWRLRMHSTWTRNQRRNVSDLRLSSLSSWQSSSYLRRAMRTDSTSCGDTLHGPTRACLCLRSLRLPYGCLRPEEANLPGCR